MKNLFLLFVIILGMFANSFAQSNAIVIGDSKWEPHSIFRFQVLDEFNNAPLKNFSVEMKRENYVGAKTTTNELGVFVLIIYNPTLIRGNWVLKVYDPNYEYTAFEQIITQSNVYFGRNKTNVLILYDEFSKPVWWSSTSRPNKERIANLVCNGEYKIHNVKSSNINYYGPEFVEGVIKLQYKRHPKDEIYSPYGQKTQPVSNENTAYDPFLLYPEEKITLAERERRMKQTERSQSSSYREAKEKAAAEVLIIENQRSRQQKLEMENEELKRKLKELNDREKNSSTKNSPTYVNEKSGNWSAPIGINSGYVSSEISNRKIKSIVRDFPYISSGGIVIVKISVDSQGRIISAKAGEKGSTVTNPQLLKAVELNALKMKFDEGNTPIQVGRLRYSIESSRNRMVLLMVFDGKTLDYVTSFQKYGELRHSEAITVEKIKEEFSSGEITYSNKKATDIVGIYIGNYNENYIFVIRSKVFPEIYGIGFGTSKEMASTKAKKSLEKMVLNVYNSSNTSFDIILDKSL